MELKQLGQTDLRVSPIGLGTVKFGRNTQVKYPNAFDLPDDQAIKKLLHACLELGVNLIDTAPAYGSSEERLGKLLPGPRHQWVIFSKAGEEFTDHQSSFNFSAEHITHSVERSLTHLKTDYLDGLLIHSNGDDVAIIEQMAVFDTCQRLKQAGKIRCYGMSTKTIEGGKLTVQHADLVMATLNPDYQDELPVLELAAQQQKGVFIKKAFASGHLAPEASLDYLKTQPGITSIITGTLSPTHLKQNLKRLLDPHTF